MGSGCSTCRSFQQKNTQYFQKIKEIEQITLSIQLEMAEDSLDIDQLLKQINEQFSHIPDTSLNNNEIPTIAQNFQNIKEIEQTTLSIQLEMAEDSLEIRQLLNQIFEQLSHIPNTSLNSNQIGVFSQQ